MQRLNTLDRCFTQLGFDQLESGHKYCSAVALLQEFYKALRARCPLCRTGGDTAFVGWEPSPEIDLICSVEKGMIQDLVLLQHTILICWKAVCK